MTLKGKKIGFAVTGSFCTFKTIYPQMQNLIEEGAEVIPIFSYSADLNDTRFFKCDDFRNLVTEITGHKPFSSITDVEPIGPKGLIDILLIAPCTGNTLAKLNAGIADTPVTLAVKSHLRNNRPVVIAISTNDALANNFKNIGYLMNQKNIYFVPFGQDNHVIKPNSMVAHFDLIKPTLELALNYKQIQPVLV
ncbi:MAG: dipicolinate synthase subunit B [Lachnospiraceae bacterium]|nr:dipicolinate synthase subunit B [Lachnospiraceae bacterium]